MPLSKVAERRSRNDSAGVGRRKSHTAVIALRLAALLALLVEAMASDTKALTRLLPRFVILL
jgi:hypothetical protein